MRSFKGLANDPMSRASMFGLLFALMSLQTGKCSSLLMQAQIIYGIFIYSLQRLVNNVTIIAKCIWMKSPIPSLLFFCTMHFFYSVLYTLMYRFLCEFINHEINFQLWHSLQSTCVTRPKHCRKGIVIMTC